ncbi:MAG: TcfC E-set like domain-containing protein [Geminicoccaceae bacterium]
MPEGFESLEEPQTAPVDVYFGLRRVGSVTATFAPGWVELRDPAAAAALVRALRPDRMGEVTAALTGRLDPHTDRSCAPEQFPGCGTLDVPIAGAIFNPDYFRLDLVFAPAVLLEQAMSGRYLEDPITGPSFIANLRAGGSGSSTGDNLFMAGVDSWLSWGRNALRFDATSQTDNRVSVVQRLSAERFGRDRHLSGGLIDDYGTRFSRVPGLLGTRLQTYLDTRLDLATASGTPIPVFLRERSQVDVLVDGRLVATGAYDAGNQRIDTSALPTGAYDVTLRIRGASGSVREERISFVKDQSFPPAGEWQYFAEGGMVTNDQEPGVLPTIVSTPIVKGGVSRRLLDDLAGGIVLSATDRDLLGELDLRYILPSMTGGVQVGATSGGGLGFGANLSWYKGPLSLGLSGDVVMGPGSQVEDDSANDWRRFNGLDASRRSVSASVGYRLEDGTSFRVNGFYRDQDGTNWGVGAQVARSLYRGRTISADLSLSAAAGNNESLALAQVSFSWSPEARPYRIRGNLGARWRDGKGGDQGFGGMGLIGGTYELEDVLGGPTTLGAEAARDIDGTNRVTLSSDSQTVWGSMSAAMDLQNGGDAPSQALYRGFARTTVAANSDGVAVGGTTAGDAAILARFQGDRDAGGLSVDTASGIPVTVQVGHTAVVPVAPFHVYEPYARAADEQIIDLKQPTESLPLYPGNVATATWKARRLFSIYGRIVSPAGAPVANARIQDVEDFAFTDEDGNFVVEVEEGGPHRVEPMDGGTACTIDLLSSMPPKGEDVIGAGDVVCRPAS